MQRHTVTVQDSLFDPDERNSVVQVRKTSHRSLYRVFLYLEGPDLPFVSGVTYHLHETFSPQAQRVQRTLSNQRCKLVIWTWGVFNVQALVEDKQGRTFRLSHYLEYTRDLSKPGIEFQTT